MDQRKEGVKHTSTTSISRGNKSYIRHKAKQSLGRKCKRRVVESTTTSEIKDIDTSENIER